MDLICDTDILSSLAKIKYLDLLNQLFPKSKKLIPTGVYEELERSKEIGYDFPDRIFSFTKTISMDDDELEEYKIYLTEKRKLDKGELQCLVISKYRGFTLITNDTLARKEAKERDIKTYNLAEIIRAAYLDEKLSKNEVKQMIKELKEKDYFSFSDETELYK